VVGELLHALPSGRPDVLLSSFSVEALEAAARCVPDLPRALLVDTFTPASLVQARQLGCVSLNVGLTALKRPMPRPSIQPGSG
jgi:glycerophosphoryl diester phosphodiesterase